MDQLDGGAHRKGQVCGPAGGDLGVEQVLQLFPRHLVAEADHRGRRQGDIAFLVGVVG